MATAVQHAATTADGHTRPPPTTEADGADEEALSLLGAVPRAAPSLTRTDSVLLHSQRTFALLMGIVIVVVEAVPFGLAIFPSELRLSGVCGIQIFLLSSAVGQAVLTLGSQFDMATGLMMCENVPLMHELSAGIHAYLAPRGRGASTMSTIIAACALSTLAVGVGFYALGALRLGALVGRLPAHSLLGCIGGVAFFTTQLGFEVSTALPFAWWQPAHMRALLRPDELPLWTLSYGLALGLRALSARIKSPVLTPAYFLAIPFVAHGALFALGMRSSDARVARYFFASPNAVEAAADASAGAEQRPLVRDHFELYGAFDPRLVAWDAMAMQLPVLLAIVGFSLAHVPINVPALTLTSGVRADVDTELRVHGAACVLAGCVGWPPAYMCYANTATYLKCGGGGRVYGGLLAVAMVVFAHVGPQCISVVPRCMVAALFFHIGIELGTDSFVAPRAQMGTIEYACLWAVSLTIALVGMTEGVALSALLGTATLAAGLQPLSIDDHGSQHPHPKPKQATAADGGSGDTKAVAAHGAGAVEGSFGTAVNIACGNSAGGSVREDADHAPPTCNAAAASPASDD